ncbi:Kinetochore protein spc25 [Schizosaccharomyces pombe]
MSLANFPTIELDYDSLKSKISNFNSIFDRFLQEERKKLLNNKNEYLRQLSEINEAQKKAEKSLEQTEARKQNFTELLEKEHEEQAITEQEIFSFQEKLDAMLKRKQKLSEELDHYRAIISSKRELRAQEMEAKRKQDSYNNPELKFWEDYLGLKMEGVHDEVIRFIFTNIDEKDWNKQFSFQINLAERDYKVVHCHPPLPHVDDLICGRDSVNFIERICLN